MLCRHCVRTQNPHSAPIVWVAKRIDAYIRHLNRCEPYKQSSSYRDYIQSQARSPGREHHRVWVASSPHNTERRLAFSSPTMAATDRRIGMTTPSRLPSRQVQGQQTPQRHQSGQTLGQKRRAGDEPNTTSAKKQKKIDNYFTRSGSDFTPKLRELLLQFQADVGLPDSFIERKSTRRLFEFLNEHCASSLPTRRQLGGNVVTEHAKISLESQKQLLLAEQTATGCCVNFLSDVWKNISKAHVMGCQLALFGHVYTFDLKQVGGRHDAIAIAETIENVLEETLGSEWRIGSVVTDNAGQCARARRILALRWPQVVFLFCFAHAINNLVNAVLKSPYRDVTHQAATIANTLNASSSKWLFHAKTFMSHKYGKSRAILKMCETRWNSMQACFALLLRVRGALSDMVDRYRYDAEFPQALLRLGDGDFWSQLEAAELAICPLCNASFTLQRNENTMADVVACLRDIYLGFKASDRRATLVPCVEKRWGDCEQPLFMLAFFLHPKYILEARKVRKTAITLSATLISTAVYYYRRLIDDKDTGTIFGDMMNFLNGDFPEGLSEETLPVILRGFDNPFIDFWNYVRTVKRKSKLPDLAIRILSISVNTATCERLFSELARIHTPARNRMSVEKSLMYYVVRQEVRELDRRESTRGKHFIDRIVCATELDKRTARDDINDVPDESFEEIENECFPPTHWVDVLDDGGEGTHDGSRCTACDDFSEQAASVEFDPQLIDDDQVEGASHACDALEEDAVAAICRLGLEPVTRTLPRNERSVFPTATVPSPKRPLQVSRVYDP